MGRVESQLIGSDILDVRAIVDTAYERIVQSMFDSLKQMAKMQGEGEDKGQLNYHVELVGELCPAPCNVTRLMSCPREYAPFHHRDYPTGGRKRKVISATSPGDLRRELKRLYKARSTATIGQDLGK